jgi:predicted ArsR family transcriptional regulator
VKIDADPGTRSRVLRELLRTGACTAAELSDSLGISPAGIRRHLDALLAEGAIHETAAHPRGPRGRGRPAKHYALTESGHAAGPQSYDDLAANALRWLGEHAGEDAVAAFAQAQAAELERRLEAARDADGTLGPEALAEALSAHGYAATVRTVPTGTTVCQHHCPVQAVAAQFPQLCEAETAALARVLGTHVQRLATIAHGDGVCTTHIPSTTNGAPA